MPGRRRSTFTPKSPFGSRVDDVPAPTNLCSRCGLSIGDTEELCAVCEQAWRRELAELPAPEISGRFVFMPPAPPKPSVVARPAVQGKRRYDLG